MIRRNVASSSGEPGTSVPGGNAISLGSDVLDSLSLAEEVLARCDILAGCSEESGRITRTFPSEPMRAVHERLDSWMRAAGMVVRLDPAGNLIGHYPAACQDAPVFLIGSHLDSVPDAGKYDGVLGVLLGVAAVQALGGNRLPFAVEILGFCEEEGVRFQTPYLGSRAICGCFDPALLERTDAAGVSLAMALRNFGLDPTRLQSATYPAGQVLGYLEAHIEQGPVLDTQNVPLGVVEAIVGQSRLWLRFEGKAGHAGTLPMELRQDALVAAAELVVAIEQHARSLNGLRATVGTLSVAPGAVNVVPGSAKLSLDIRHPHDAVRERATAALLEHAATIGRRRHVGFHVDHVEHHLAVPADPRLTDLLTQAAQAAGYAPLWMVSGAGHDAAVMAALAPMTMLFLRSPGGVSHHPGEAVLPEDVKAALEVMVEFLHRVSGDLG
jgi:allantoate deiminase